MKLCTKYQDPGLLVSDKKILEGFLYIGLCKPCPSWDEAFSSPWAILNNLGKGSLGEAMYQISKAWACFLKIFKVFSLYGSM